jgi:excisionase family DNA binding protein
MVTYSSNDTAVPYCDRLQIRFVGNFTRCAVAGQMRGASCATTACIPLEYELSKQTNLSPAENGGAHHNPQAAASQTSRLRRRRGRTPSGYITVSQLADRADAALSTAYVWVETGRIPAARWRGRLIVSEKAVDAFLAIEPLKQITDSGDAKVTHD